MAIETVPKSGSQVVVEALLNAGVEVVFGYPGGAIMPLYDLLRDSPIEHVLTRHEQAAIHAADGYARASGRLGACLTTSGPGATNLVTGICTAMADSSPVLCMSGQVSTETIGTDAFQEADMLGIVTAITKQSFLARSPDDLPGMLAEALYVAGSGRPGPVFIDLPKNVLLGTTRRRAPQVVELPGYEPVPGLDEVALLEAHELLRRAQRPVCIVGGGCKLAGATSAFRRWCQRTQIPVATTLNGIGAPEPHYRGNLGMPGMYGVRAANQAIAAADVIIALGMRFDDRVTGRTDEFGRQARIVHVDIDAAEIGKIIPVDVAVNADLRGVLEAWLVLLEIKPAEPCVSWQNRATSAGHGLLPPVECAHGQVSAVAVIDALMDLIDPDTTVTADVGQHQMWVAQRLFPSDPRRFLTSGGAGTMGFGLPAALGAQYARPGAKVVAVVGDGGIQMSLAELVTIRRCGLPIKIMVVDNRCLGMVRQWQDMFFNGRQHAVDMSDNPDFAALARVYGLSAFTLDRAEAVRSELHNWWNCEGPALLHCLCPAEESVFPMIPPGGTLADMLEAG